MPTADSHASDLAKKLEQLSRVRYVLSSFFGIRYASSPLCLLMGVLYRPFISPRFFANRHDEIDIIKKVRRSR